MTNLILAPYNGLLALISIAILVIKLVALIDAAVRPSPAYPAAEKQTKVFWLVILALAVVLNGAILTIAGLIAAIVYLVDVRPAIRAVQGRGKRRPDPWGP
jgi:hypothetical protein